MTLIDTQNVQYGSDSRAWIPSSKNPERVRAAAHRPSGASAYRCVLHTRSERALMATIGRPWA